MGLNDGSGIPKILVFRPTIEEMSDFSKYLEKMESKGANKAGLAKIIPPPEWCPRKNGYNDDYVNEMIIKAPIKQIRYGREGVCQQYSIQKKSITVRDFKKLAESKAHKTPHYFDYKDLERKYWNNLCNNPAIYGADVPGTLYDPGVEQFNINNLNTILDLVNDSYGIKIMGVNTAYLYFGMWKTTFAWHTEDMDLYSINYLHFGAPKSWYAIPPEHGRRFERLAAIFFPSSYKNCPSFLRHKMTIISPHVLKQYSIPYNKITQEPGEFMITFPCAYHCGYNHGYNCAEATNFALPRWVEYGKRATKCLCRSDSVKISMETFVKKFQPDRYELWLQGKDVGPHPEDPSHISAAPPPSNYELAVLSKVTTNKNKRQHAYKGDSYDDSDAEEYSDSSCEGSSSSLVRTKAEKKLFDSTDPDTSIPPESYLTTSPPNLMILLKELHKNGAPKKKKRKKKASSNNTDRLVSHSFERECTTTSIPLNWATLTVPSVSPDVSQMLSSFFNTSDQRIPGLNGVNKTENSLAPFEMELSNTSSIPPTPLQPIQTQMASSQSFDSFTNRNDFEHLPPPPPLGQESISVTDSNSDQNTLMSELDSRVFNPDLSTFSQFMTSATPSLSEINVEENFTDDTIVFDETENNIDIPSGNAKECTSTEDLLVNDIIINTKTVEASKIPSLQELLQMICDGGKNSELSHYLKWFQIPIHLYQHLPHNSFAEQLFNANLSTIYPHCSVCVLLKKFEIRSDWLDAQQKIPKSSPVLIPNAAFAFRVIDPNPTLDECVTSPLIVCCDCKVCVHEVCYGVINNNLDLRNWKCDRCQEKKADDNNCCLCPFRGGALKITEDPNVWVHITCALMQPVVKFKDVITKSPIDISGVKKTRGLTALKCVFCHKANNGLAGYTTGYCIQCYRAPKCPNAFHVTCAHIAGIRFESSDWPYPIRAYCKKCSNISLKNSSAIDSDKDDVELNTRVIAKHRNRRYYNAVVIKKEKEIIHSVLFVDNSFSNKVKTSDILSHDSAEISEIQFGDQVKVSWNKEILTGKYSGNHSINIYTVMFEDNSQNKVRREDFYFLDETLPKKVAQKFSQATDQRHNALFIKSEKNSKVFKKCRVKHMNKNET